MRPCRATPELREKELKRDNASRRRRYAENKEKRLAANREWKRANQEKIYLSNSKRRALLREAVGYHSLNDLLLIREEQGNKCPGCLSLFTDDLPATIDHFVPLSKGGSNWADNTQLLCRPCNCSKKDKLWKDWVN